MPSYRVFASLRVLPLVLLLAACESGGAVDLLPLDPQEVRVSETLTLSLPVQNPTGRAITLRIEPPMPSIPAFESVTSLTSSPSGGEFRWTPLASHIREGGHELIFVVSGADGTELDRERVVVRVLPSDDSAPVFLRPGAGGTFDLSRETCVRFDVEVRDDDSAFVEIRERMDLPEGATFSSTGPKSADFEWCPTRDQIGASQRWTIAMEADDGDHPPVPHDFVVVLRSGGGTGCTGAPPAIALVAPLSGERITSSSGYEVSARVTDDLGLRDAPLLYWTTEAPDDPSAPDITSFNQVVFTEDASERDLYRARIPSLGLAEGGEARVWYLVSATDNDDAMGTACDHAIDSALIQFDAVGGAGGGGDLGQCTPCTASTECASGICIAAAGGARCLTSCAAGTPCVAGTCAGRVTVEGATREACGDVATVCGGGTGTCTDDSLEPNDSIAMATRASTARYDDLQICSGNSDYFRIDGSFRELVTVRVEGFRHAEGDLDLRLRSASGTIVASSAGTADTEMASYCMGDGESVFAQVFGYRTAQNGYDLVITREAGACCRDDDGEPDDTPATARPLDPGGDFSGSICPMDDDHIAIDVAGGARIEIDLVFDGAMGDIDLALLSPEGTELRRSAGTGDSERIDLTVSSGGRYVARVYGYEGDANPYIGMVTLTPVATCMATSECGAGDVCASGTCRSDACTSMAMCPASHLCPSYGPAPAARHCGQVCSVNSECRASEACKWFPEGRACGERGTGINGAACASAAACGGQRACVSWPGGYCARAGCSTNADCETGTYCVDRGGARVCALSCVSASCRESEGYSCEFLPTLGGTSRFVCVP